MMYKYHMSFFYLTHYCRQSVTMIPPKPNYSLRHFSVYTCTLGGYYRGTLANQT
jgi:hypothetical protein